MKRYDLLHLNRVALRVFAENGISPTEVFKLPIFEEYIDLRNSGEKYEYVVEHLARKYNISPRSVANIAKRMTEDIKLST